MLTDGSLTDIAALGGPAAAGGQRRRGGRPGVAAVRADRQPALAPGAGRRPTPPTRCTPSRSSAASAMRDLGITIDFAPVVDVTDAPDDTVIGDRSFGADPAKVTEYAGAYARGLRDAGLLPVLKHFPGHGHGSGDSHTGGVVTPPLGGSADQRPDALPHADHAGAGRRHGRTHAGARPDRQRPGQPEPRGRSAAAQRATTAARRSTARCSPTTCPACGRSTSGTASPRRRCGPAGRCRHRVVGHHRRGARGAGPAGEGAGRRAN